MNKLVWGGVAGLVVTAYVGTTVYARSQVPAAYAQLSAEVARKFPMAQLSHTLQNHGLFSSKVEVSVKLGCNTDAKEVFKYVDTVTHGPFLWAHGFGLAYIDSELVLDDATKADIAKAFGKDKLLNISTRIAFNGTATINISSPARSFTDSDKQADVKWGGLQSEFVIVDAEKGHFDKLTFDMPELTVNGQTDNSHFSIMGAKLAARQTGMAGDIALSDTGLSIKSITVANDAKHLSFSANDLTLNASNTASGEFMGVSEIFGIKSIKVNNRDYGPVDLKLLFNHLHMPSFVALQNDLESAQALVCKDPAASQAGVMAAIQKHGTAILVNAPEIELQSLKARFPEGEISLSAKASIPGFTATDAALDVMALPTVLMQKLKAEGNITAAQGVLKYFAQLSPMGATFDQTSAAVVAAGLVTRKGGDFTVNAKWENGAALINGLPQGEVMQRVQAALATSAPPATEAEMMEEAAPAAE